MSEVAGATLEQQQLKPSLDGAPENKPNVKASARYREPVRGGECNGRAVETVECTAGHVRDSFDTARIWERTSQKSEHSTHSLSGTPTIGLFGVLGVARRIEHVSYGRGCIRYELRWGLGAHAIWEYSCKADSRDHAG
ncbi:hypothetical protein DFH08DRAFT_804026 [Mycena albidolilacea]|uniref:Uncharacterized protein n=1 Tax=Mycena albidolilacea TaxID=1033008 RepID=A0AAD7EX50_9AGAR|nr:hypothetical protein DFH08DRAFT_804026 [Mycena albidolilacea]